MGKKRETAKKCRQILKLIDENQYKAALEILETVDLTLVSSTQDLYDFAELYERAGRIDKKKDIYYIVYERAHTSCVLYHLLKLVIRMGDMQEARELFTAYEVLGGATLDTYELRYRLACAEGRSRAELIQILEELKHEEYTEEWGYQLALLYELEGERLKCIQECNDLKLWFGEGRIVDKAMRLKERCEDRDWEPPIDEVIPEPEQPEVYKTYSYASPSVSVMDMDEEETVKPAESSVESIEDTVKETAEGIVEDIAQETVNFVETFEEGIVKDTVEETVKSAEPFAELPVEGVLDTEAETASEEDEFADLLDVKSILKKMLPRWGKSSDKKGDEEDVEVDSQTEFPEEEQEAVSEVVSETVSEAVPEDTERVNLNRPSSELEEILYQTGPLPKLQMEVQDSVVEPMPQMEVVSHDTEKLPSIEEALERRTGELALGGVSEPKVVPGTSRVAKVMEVKPQEPVESLDEMLEDTEDVSANGIHYRTLKNAIHHIKRNENEAHFVFAGGEERITLAVARRLVKELNNVGYASAQGIGKTSAEKVNDMSADTLMEKIRQCGGCMLVTGASELSGESVQRIISLMDEQKKSIIVMLSAPFDEIDSFLSFYPILAEKISYKIRM